MKEIKFRAWDTVLNKIVTWEDLLNRNKWNLSLEIFNNPSYSFMQYTEVKDMNGNEIYEGDILSYWWSGRKMGVVEFKNGAYYVRHYLLSDLPDDTKVIGNMYEDPIPV